ncbi:glycosyltransferase family 2 protein [Nonomuraea sp. NBC_01738]|uniref:glycosyltransferase family 2 protein n=1 Tax=Nonomuraea sp. NBC_01738 TaxID=2976003 RepID=UPI002E131DF8|nr:glycosyltransferase family 2 protein [Nonomuraea sp. NBC_01738]
MYVTAIVVAHDGGRWLEETLQALLGQARQPDRVVAADNGSRDGSAALMKRALGERNVLTLPRSTGFGEAVAEVLDKLPAQPDEWIWLLHDDCAPDRNALAALLWAAEQDRKAAVLGPKLRDWLDRRRLLEVGVTVDRTGRRDTGLEPHEFDQGQHDGLREVLSVSTAGMLIRRDVWEAVGGLDPFFPLFRDDLDLCWRVRNAGHKVLNVTAAVAWHAEAATRRRRRIAVSGDHPRRLDRRNAIFVIMANLPFQAMLGALVRNVFGSVLRTLLFLVGKQPASALDELVALGSILVHPFRLMRARRARRDGRKKGYFRIKNLLTPRGAAYRRLADMVQSFLAGESTAEGRHHAGAAEDDEEPPEDTGAIKRFFARPGVIMVIALTVITLVAERSLLGGERLGGGALVPVTGGAGDLWRLYTEPFHQAGLGSTGWAPPYLAVLAALSTITLGKTWLAVSLLLLGSVPLSGASAYLATRHIIPAVSARVWLAATYALLPVATGAVAAGRLGTCVVLFLLPIYVALGTMLLSAERRRARRAAWGLGVLLAVGTAFVPLVYPLFAVLGVLAAVAFGGVRRGVVVSMAIALAVPVALLLPWLAGLVTDPGRILLEAGLQDPSLADPSLAPESLLALSPGGPGLPPVWITAGLIAAALGALLVRRQRMVVAIGWGVALFGVLAAILASRVSAGGGQAWPGVPLAFAATGLLVPAGLSAHRLPGLRAAGGLRRAVALAVTVVAFSTPVLAAGYWMYTGVRGPLRGDAGEVVPALAGVRTQGERAVVIKDHRFTILHGTSPLIGESELPGDPAARARVAEAAAGLASGRGGKDAATLASLGVGLIAAAPPVSRELAAALDSQPSLIRQSLSQYGGVWRLADPPARIQAPPPGVLHTPWLWTQAALALLVLVMAAPGRRDGQVQEHVKPAAPVLAGVS